MLLNTKPGGNHDKFFLGGFCFGESIFFVYLCSIMFPGCEPEVLWLFGRSSRERFGKEVINNKYNAKIKL